MQKIIIAIFIFIGTINAQSAEEKVEQLQNKFRTIIDFQAEFKQASDNPNFNVSQSFSGTFYYKKGNKFVIDLSKTKIVSDGQTLWNYDNNQNRTVINSWSEDSEIISLKKIVFEYPDLCNVSIDKNDFNKLIFIPNSTELNFEQAIISLTKDNLISKIKIIDLTKAEIIFEFSNYKLNKDLPDDFFEFNIPEDSKVIDFR